MGSAFKNMCCSISGLTDPLIHQKIFSHHMKTQIWYTLIVKGKTQKQNGQYKNQPQLTNCHL